LVVELPELLPLELPMPLLEPVLGDGVVLGEVVVLPLLPLVPPLAAPEPDLLKWASHSERDTCPSLFESTAEKLGAALVALVLLPPDRPPLELPAAAPPLEDDVPEEPDDAGDDEELSPLVLLDEELCATATPDKANSAAAVAALRSFRFSIGKSPSDEMERAAFCLDARDVPFHPVSALALSTFPLHPLLAGDLTFAR